MFIHLFMLETWPVVWVGKFTDKLEVEQRLLGEWDRHTWRLMELLQEQGEQVELLRQRQLVYQQYEYMTEVLKDEIWLLVNRMNHRLMEQMALEEVKDDEEVVAEVENASKAMLANATEMLSSLDPYKDRGGLVEAHHWARRERFWRELVEWAGPRFLDTTWGTGHDPVCTLGQSDPLLFGGGHHAPGMVLPGKEEQLPWFRQARLGPGDPRRFLQTVRSLSSSLTCQLVSMGAGPQLFRNRRTSLRFLLLRLPTRKVGSNTTTGNCRW
jgi:hypothetical protein